MCHLFIGSLTVIVHFGVKELHIHNMLLGKKWMLFSHFFIIIFQGLERTFFKLPEDRSDFFAQLVMHFPQLRW